MSENYIIEGKRARDYYRRTKDSDTTKKMLDFILGNIKLDKNSLIADLAAGSGNFAEYLKSKVKRIDAIDLSEEMVKIMRRRFKSDDRVRVIKADIRNTGLESDAYDAAILIMSLHHIRDARGVLNGVSRILSANGRFILIDRLAVDKKLAEDFDIADAREKGIEGGHGHVQRTEKELGSLLNENFKILRKSEMPYDGDEAKALIRVLYSLEKS